MLKLSPRAKPTSVTPDSCASSIARLDGADTAATIGTLDASAKVGFYPSVMVGADGLALISYFDEANEHLKVAHCSTAPCTPLRLTADGRQKA